MFPYHAQRPTSSNAMVNLVASWYFMHLQLPAKASCAPTSTPLLRETRWNPLVLLTFKP